IMDILLSSAKHLEGIFVDGHTQLLLNLLKKASNFYSFTFLKTLRFEDVDFNQKVSNLLRKTLENSSIENLGLGEMILRSEAPILSASVNLREFYNSLVLHASDGVMFKNANF